MINCSCGYTIPPVLDQFFFLAVTHGEGEIGDSLELGILRYSSIGVQGIIFEFKSMIYERISAK